MKSMVLHTIRKPLELQEIAEPKPDDHQLKMKVHTCGIPAFPYKDGGKNAQ